MKDIILPLLSHIKMQVRLPWLHREILRQFVRRELLSRYRGSLLGMVWMLLSPLLTLGVYTFVFVGVFSAKWPGAETGGGMGFALRIFSGLLIFSFFSDVLGRASGLILEQPNLVKKVVFPLELLAYISVASAFFQLMVSCVILALGVMIFGDGLTASFLLLPVIVLPLIPLLLGLSWLLSSIGVYIRDTGQAVGLVINFLLFLTPIFYAVRSIPADLQMWMGLNPMTHVIENLRLVVFAGTPPDWTAWLYGMGAGLIMAIAGASTFYLLRDGFSDVV